VDAVLLQARVGLGPMPLILRQGSGQICVCRSASCTMLMPLGLLNSLAILASSLLGATPTEQVRPVASRMLLQQPRQHAPALALAAGHVGEVDVDLVDAAVFHHRRDVQDDA
jgi:hypothetical protein